MNITNLAGNEIKVKADLPQHIITFFSATAWVMRITADRRIEVNEGVEVTEAAQAVLDALAPMLFKPLMWLTMRERSRDMNAEAASELRRLHQCLRNVYEVWAGSEGIPAPTVASEAYLLSLVEQMRDAAKEGLNGG